jgi:hypothetical protein
MARRFSATQQRLDVWTSKTLALVLQVSAVKQRGGFAVIITC